MTTGYVALHALSPLHPGAGQGVGAVDLPVARQRPSGFPYVPGSTLKGCLRTLFEDSDQTRRVFGPPPTEGQDRAGDVFFGDAYLAALPVRSLDRTFVWVSCDYLVQGLRRLGIECALEVADGDVQVENGVRFKNPRTSAELADFVAKTTGHDPGFVAKRLYIVSDDEFAWAAEFGTQIDIRNRVDQATRVVIDGALWSEESLAPESVLVAPVAVRHGFSEEDVHPLLGVSQLLVGGKNTVGRGLAGLTWQLDLGAQR